MKTKEVVLATAVPREVKLVFSSMIIISLAGFLAACEVCFWLIILVFFLGLCLALTGVFPAKIKAIVMAFEEIVQ
ncbi:MAG: hypothetical protein WCK11_05550 [Candidatus Falkowbacteria bacterium]